MLFRSDAVLLVTAAAVDSPQVDNGIKYSPRGADLVLRVRRNAPPSSPRAAEGRMPAGHLSERGAGTRRHRQSWSEAQSRGRGGSAAAGSGGSPSVATAGEGASWAGSTPGDAGDSAAQAEPAGSHTPSSPSPPRSHLSDQPLPPGSPEPLPAEASSPLKRHQSASGASAASSARGGGGLGRGSRATSGVGGELAPRVEHVLFECIDRGVGMSPAALEVLFKPFSQPVRVLEELGVVPLFPCCRTVRRCVLFLPPDTQLRFLRLLNLRADSLRQGEECRNRLGARRYKGASWIVLLDVRHLHFDPSENSAESDMDRGSQIGAAIRVLYPALGRRHEKA